MDPCTVRNERCRRPEMLRHRSEWGGPWVENRGARYRNEGRTRPEWGVCAIKMWDSTSLPEGGEGLKTGIHRSECPPPPIATRGARDQSQGCNRAESGAPPAGNGPATDRKFPLHFSKRRKPQRRKDLLREMAPLIFREVAPSISRCGSPHAKRSHPSCRTVPCRTSFRAPAF